MKYVPHSITVVIIGLAATIRGIVAGQIIINVIGDLIALAGVVWLFFAWDKLMDHVRAEKKAGRRMDRIEAAQGNTDLIARAADRNARDAVKAVGDNKKRVGQSHKGFIRHGDKIICIERREA